MKEQKKPYELSTRQQRKIMHDLGGNLISECDGPNRSDLRFWNIDGHVIITQVWPEGGWDFYLPGKTRLINEIEGEINGYLK